MSSAESRVRELEKVYKQMSTNINRYHKYEPWLTFSLINDYENESITALTVDTYSSKVTVRFANQSSTVCPIMLVNFEYNKNGSGSANSFTLTFAFNPTERNDSGGKLLDAMIIDKALTISSFFRRDENQYRAIDTIAKHKCFMRFGYAYNGEMIQSPEYYGQALSAKSELRDGMIYYTITGYSSVTYIADFKLDITTIGKTEDGKVTEGVRASSMMATAIYSAFKSDGDSGCEVKVEGDYSPELVGSKIKSNLTSKALGVLYKGMKVNIKNNVTKSGTTSDKEIIIEETSAGLFDFLKSLASSADLTCNENKKEKDKRATLTYSLEELDNELNFEIYINNPTEDTATTTKELQSNIVYEYPTKENNIVKSFTPDFNFENIWNKDIFLDDNDKAKSWFIDKDNVARSYEDSNNTSFLTGDAGKSAKSISTFSDAIQFAYTAEMTTIGIPADIPIGTLINIKPIINGQEYHYAGKYMVTKTIDRIDTNGYTTEYELFKIVPPSSEVEEILEQKKQESETQQNKTNQQETNKIDINKTKYPPGFIGPIPSTETSLPYNRPVINTKLPEVNLVQGNIGGLREVPMGPNGKPNIGLMTQK